MAATKTYQQLKDIIPLYRIGEGFAVDKNGSLTIGFKISFPSVHNINIGDFAITDENPAGLNLNMNLQLAIKDLPDNYILHHQDWQWFAPPMDIPNNHNFLNNATRKMYGDQKVFSHAAYLFVTKRSAAFKDVDFSSEAVKIFEEQIENFQAKIPTLKPVKMNDNDWLNYLDSVFALDHSDRDKVLLDIDFEKQEFGDYKFVGYTVNGDSASCKVNSTNTLLVSRRTVDFSGISVNVAPTAYCNGDENVNFFTFVTAANKSDIEGSSNGWGYSLNSGGINQCGGNNNSKMLCIQNTAPGTYNTVLTITRNGCQAGNVERGHKIKKVCRINIF